MTINNNLIASANIEPLEVTSLRPMDLKKCKPAYLCSDGSVVEFSASGKNGKTFDLRLQALIHDPKTKEMIDKGLQIHQFFFRESSIQFTDGSKVYFKTDAGPMKDMRDLLGRVIDPKGKNPVQYPERVESGVRGLTLIGANIPQFSQGYVPFTASLQDYSKLPINIQKQNFASVEVYNAIMKELDEKMKKCTTSAEKKRVQRAADELSSVKMDLVAEALANPPASNSFKDLKAKQKEIKKHLLSRLPKDPNKIFSDLFNRTLDITPNLERSIEILSVRITLARVIDRNEHATLLKKFSDDLDIEILEATDSMEEAFIHLGIATEQGDRQMAQSVYREIEKLFNTLDANDRKELSDNVFKEWSNIKIKLDSVK
jgi:hypothetical protein